MFPSMNYQVARAKIDDEHRAAERRRVQRIAAESRPPRDGGVSIVGRVWELLTGINPAPPALAGDAK